MADAVIKTVFSGRNKIVVDVTGIFSAGDTDTVVIDKSTLTGPLGREPDTIRIDELTWTVSPGFDYLLLEWDHTTDDRIETLSGPGYMSYVPFGGKVDPKSAGATGDVVLTSAGGAAGDAYSVLIVATLKGGI